MHPFEPLIYERFARCIAAWNVESPSDIYVIGLLFDSSWSADAECREVGVQGRITFWYNTISHYASQIAYALHGAILDEIACAARHSQRIDAYLTKVATQLPDVTTLHAQDHALELRLRETERKIGRIRTAIEESDGELRSLLERLKELEQERMTVKSERLRLDAETKRHQQTRPDTEAIRSRWERFVELWEYFTHEERERAMQLLVEKVEIQNKTEGVCRIRLSASLPSENVGLTEQNTPRGGLEPPTFRLTAERSAIELTGNSAML